ncbi:MAG: hypothetical protein AB1420_11085 [Bacillota bacterium]
MKLHQKTLIVIIINNTVYHLEMDLAEQNLKRGIRALKSDTKVLKSIVTDWAIWDDVYEEKGPSRDVLIILIILIIGRYFNLQEIEKLSKKQNLLSPSIIPTTFLMTGVLM